MAAAGAAEVANGTQATPEEILVLQDILTRKTNTYIYNPLKRKQLAAGDGALALKPRPVQLDSVAALLAIDDTEDEEEEEARGEAPPGPPAEATAARALRKKQRKCPDDSAAEEYAVRRDAREVRRRQEEARTEQYLLELRIREEIAQAAQQQWHRPNVDVDLRAPYYRPPSTAVTSSAPVAAAQPPTPCGAPGVEAQTASGTFQFAARGAPVFEPPPMPYALGGLEAPRYASPVAGGPDYAEQQQHGGAAAFPNAALAAMHPTAVAFLRDATEPLRYTLPQQQGNGGGAKGGGGTKGCGGVKGCGKGHGGKAFHNGQEICKEYHRKFGRCSYAERTGNPRGCKFYHAEDEELQMGMARLGSDSRYDLYDEVCLLLSERRHGGGGAGGAPRGVFTPAEL
jgi:hypothetical protein